VLGPGGPPGPDCTWSVEFQMLPVGPPSYDVHFPFWPTVTVQCDIPCVFAVGPHDPATVQPVELVGPLFAATALSPLRVTIIGLWAHEGDHGDHQETIDHYEGKHVKRPGLLD